MSTYLKRDNASVPILVEYFINEVAFSVQSSVGAESPVCVQRVARQVGGSVDVGGGGEPARQDYDDAGREHGCD